MYDIDALSKRRFDFLAWSMGIVILCLALGSVAALFLGKATFTEFSAALGTLGGLLVGLWKRDQA